jgi:hypothetical protein
VHPRTPVPCCLGTARRDFAGCPTVLLAGRGQVVVGSATWHLLEHSNVVAEGIPDAHVDPIEVPRGLLREVGDPAWTERVIQGAGIISDERQATKYSRT